jgi:sarcosine oxidase subunit gamma
VHKLKTITALGGDMPRVDTIGALTIAENPALALASLAARQGQAQAVEKAMKDALSLDLSGPGKATGAADHAAIWMGPEQWMVAAPQDQHELLAAELKAIVGGAGSVTEQTDGWCCFDVTGPGLADLFERLSPAPLRQMAPGDAIRTTLEHLGVFLWVQDESQVTVLAPRSSAGSLHHALTAAARSIA